METEKITVADWDMAEFLNVNLNKFRFYPFSKNRKSAIRIKSLSFRIKSLKCSVQQNFKTDHSGTVTEILVKWAR